MSHNDANKIYTSIEFVMNGYGNLTKAVKPIVRDGHALSHMFEICRTTLHNLDMFETKFRFTPMLNISIKYNH